MRMIIPAFYAALFVLAFSATANSSELFKGTYGGGNNTVFQILDGTYLIYCRDGAPENLAWQCKRRKYKKTKKGFVVQYNLTVPLEDSVALEINKTDGGYQLFYKGPRFKVDINSYADTKPTTLKFQSTKYTGSFGPGRESAVTYRKGRLTYCFKKECNKVKVKSFGATIRAKFRDGVKFYVTPVSDTEVVGTYIQPDVQYNAHYKIAQ